MSSISHAWSSVWKAECRMRNGQRPRPHPPLDLPGVVRAHRRDVGLAMLPQAVRGQRPLLRDPQPDLPREVLALGADGVADDPVAVAPTPARALAHLRRDPGRDGVEERPAGPQEGDPRARAPPRPVGPCSVEEAAKEMPQKSVEPVPTLSSTTSRGPAASNSRGHPGEVRRSAGSARGTTRASPGRARRSSGPGSTRPVEAEGHRPLALGPVFDDGTDRHAPTMARGAGATLPAHGS